MFITLLIDGRLLSNPYTNNQNIQSICIYNILYNISYHIDCGFEFVDNIESINLNLVTKCFLTGGPLLIMG